MIKKNFALFLSASLVIHPTSQPLSKILYQKLSPFESLQLIDPKKVDAVLRYHPKTASPLEAVQKEARDFLERSKNHYFQLAYAEAQAESQKVIQIFVENPPLLFEAGQILQDAWIVRGLVAAAQKKKEEAHRAFEKVFHLNPNYSPGPQGFSPSVRKLFDKARQKILTDADGALSVYSSPKVAEVFLNGVYQGVAPLTFSRLTAGDYFVSVRADHYQRVDEKIVLGPHEEKILKKSLVWIGPQNIKESASAMTPQQEVEEGLRIANLLKADKVLLLQETTQGIQLRLIDRRFRASHKPILWQSPKNPVLAEKELDQLARLIVVQSQLDLKKNPYAHLDPQGLGDPILLGSLKKKFPRKILFGGLGAVGLGGLIGGILAASGSGGSSGPASGSVALDFK